MLGEGLGEKKGCGAYLQENAAQFEDYNFTNYILVTRKRVEEHNCVIKPGDVARGNIPSYSRYTSDLMFRKKKREKDHYFSTTLP